MKDTVLTTQGNLEHKVILYTNEIYFTMSYCHFFLEGHGKNMCIKLTHY